MGNTPMLLGTQLISAHSLPETTGLKLMHQEKNVAKQMEGMFIEMMLKSMRATATSGGLIKSRTVDMYTGLYDQHLVHEMTTQRSVGITQLIAKQLGVAASDTGITQTNNQKKIANKKIEKSTLNILLDSEKGMALKTSSSPKDVLFINKINQAARQASKRSGMPYQVIMAQAALESGWGKQEIVTQEGKPSYNLFGIKNTPFWQGKSTEILTTEYINGAAKKCKASFKVYQSYSDAFEDYTNLLVLNPRYRNTLQATTPETVAEQLQAAGYATDPNYANKLKLILIRLKAILPKLY